SLLVEHGSVALGCSEARVRQQLLIDADLALAALLRAVFAAHGETEVLDEDLLVITIRELHRRDVRVVGGRELEPPPVDSADGTRRAERLGNDRLEALSHQMLGGGRRGARGHWPFRSFTRGPAPAARPAPRASRSVTL